MFKNSNELLEYALRELQVAVKENKSQVEILLKSTSLMIPIKCENIAMNSRLKQLQKS